MKHIAFSVDGYIEVPDNSTKEQIQEALEFYFEVSDEMDADNPVDVGLSEVKYNSVTIDD